ncbi:unnamed protein product [Schistosoma mattheei]|uniref:Uncharacterized protein n=1 Tax=Schistosoma mattheei TaxID=31246 RepID=A0A183NVS3_9TREM|nr:unnamed protein product [Schistosoma mattheei]
MLTFIKFTEIYTFQYISLFTLSINKPVYSFFKNICFFKINSIWITTKLNKISYSRYE